MAVLFVNAAAQPVIHQEVLVATIAGPLDNLDAYVQAAAWADGFLSFFVYATVGGVRAKVATSVYQGPRAGRLQWEVGTNPPAAPVHAGGTSYDLVVFAQPTQNAGFGLSPSQPPVIAATFAGVNESDVAPDSNTSGNVAVSGGEATITTAAGFQQAADVSAVMTNMPALDFRLYASCGAGSVEALIAEQTTQGADGITSVMRGVVLPVATLYRLACAQASPGGAAANVTASLSTYENVSGAGGGGGGGGVAPGLPAQVFTTNSGPTTQWQYPPRIQINDFAGVDLTGGLPASAAIQTTLNNIAASALALDPGLEVWFDGTYAINAPISVPNLLTLRFSSTTKLVSTIVPDGNPATAIFNASPAYGGNTTLAANTKRGNNQISVNSTVGGTIAAGVSVFIGGAVPFHACSRKVTAVAGVGPFTLTLDEPLLDTYVNGENVKVIVSQPTGIQLLGAGTTLITGTGDRYVELINAYRCEVSGFTVNASAGMVTDLLFSFDNGSRECEFSHMYIDGGNVAGTVGLSFETGENSLMWACVVVNCAVAGYALYDSFSCTVRGCSAGSCAFGAEFTADGNAVGGRDNIVDGGVYDNNTIGVYVAFGTDQIVTDITAGHNGQAGVQIDNPSLRTTIANSVLGDTDNPAAAGAALSNNNGQQTKIRNCTLQNAFIGLVATTGDQLDIDGLTLTGVFGQNAVESNINVRGRGVFCNTTSTGINVWLINAGRVKIVQSQMSAGNASNLFNNSGSLSIKQSVLTVGGGGFAIYNTGGDSEFDATVDLGTSLYSVVGGVLRGAFSLNAKPVAAGGTFTFDIPIPTDSIFHGDAEARMIGKTAAHVSDSAGLFADAGFSNNNGAMATPAALAGSANPNNSGGLIGSSGSEYCSAGFISGGGIPSTLAWSIVGTSGRLTLTNQGAAVAGVAYLDVEFEIAA